MRQPHLACRVASLASGASPSSTPTGVHPNLRKLTTCMSCSIYTPSPLSRPCSVYDADPLWYLHKSGRHARSAHTHRTSVSRHFQEHTRSKATFTTRPSSLHRSAVACCVSALHAHCDMSTATTLPAGSICLSQRPAGRQHLMCHYARQYRRDCLPTRSSDVVVLTTCRLIFQAVTFYLVGHCFLSACPISVKGPLPHQLFLPEELP